MTNIAMDCQVRLQDILPVLVSCFKASIYLMERNGSRTVKVIRPTI